MAASFPFTEPAILRLRTTRKLRVSSCGLHSMDSRRNFHLRNRVRAAAAQKEGTGVKESGSRLVVDEVGGFDLNGNGAVRSSNGSATSSSSSSSIDVEGIGLGSNGSVSSYSSAVLSGNGASSGSLVKYVNDNGNGVATGMAEVILETKAKESGRLKTIEEIGQEDAWFKRPEVEVQIYSLAGGNGV